MKREKKEYSESELPMLLQSMASLGIVVVVCVGGFFGIGFLLDKYLGFGVTGIVTSTFIGAIVAIYWAYRRVSLTLTKIYKDDIAGDESGSAENVDDEEPGSVEDSEDGEQADS